MSVHLIRLFPSWLVGLLLLPFAPAFAGVAIEHEVQPPWRHFVVSRQADGRLDPRFGSSGRVVVDGMAPAAVTSDRLGRHLIVGSSDTHPPQPIVMRLLPGGQLDTAWGERGVSTGAPVAKSSRAVAALALPDGRTLVLGQIDAGGGRAALWLVDSGGRFAPEWALLSGQPQSSAVSLVAVRGTDNAMIGIKTGDTVEGYIVDARGLVMAPERLVRQRLPDGWSAAPALVQTDQGWRWVDAEQPALAPLKAVAADDDPAQPSWTWQSGPAAVPEPMAQQPAAPSAGGAVFNPLASPLRDAVPTPSAQTPWHLRVDGADLTMAAVALLLAGFILARLFRRAWDA